MIHDSNLLLLALVAMISQGQFLVMVEQDLADYTNKEVESHLARI